MPKLSIITVNLNNAEGLHKTIESVISQTFSDYEHLIIDGNSNDGSVKIINKYASNLSYWVSEPDKGIFNAMNKGIKAAKGDFLLFLNSGDSLYKPTTLENVAQKLNNNIGIYYGDVQRIYSNGDKIIKNYNKELSFSFFVDSAIAHQSAFIKRSLFDELFYYNENLKIFADGEFLMCAICKFNVPYKHLELIVSNYDMEGISSQPENQSLMKKEREQIYRQHFPLFYKDYQELFYLKSSLNSNRMRLFIKIDNHKMTRKINYIILRILNKFLK